jgi:hypothetical protein
MTTTMPQVNTAIDQDDADWLVAEGKRLGITRSEVVRRAIRHYRACEAPAEPVKPKPTPKTEESQGDKMPKQSQRPPQIRTNRPRVTKAEKKDLPAKVACPRCGRDQWTDENGKPRYHLRAARPDEAEYNELVPTMVACD